MWFMYDSTNSGRSRRRTGRAGAAARSLITVAVIAAAILIAFGACSNPFRMHFYPQEAAQRSESDQAPGADGVQQPDGDAGGSEDPEEARLGSVRISMGQAQPMTILPDFVAIASYDITLTRGGYEPRIFAGETGDSKTVTNLAIGQWTVSVDAKDADGVVVANGQAPVTVVDTGTASVTVNLSYLAFEGQGDLEIDVTFPDVVGVDSVEYTKTPMGQATEGPFGLTITDDSGADSSVHIAEADLDAGSYTVVLTFSRGGEMIATVVEAAHVYGNHSTSPDGAAEIALAEGDFNSAPPAPTTFDVVDNADNSAGLTWDAGAVKTETHFVIQRHTSPAFDALDEEITVGANLESYDDSGISGTTEWYFRIKSRNSFGDSAWVEHPDPVVVQSVHVGNENLNSVSDLTNFAAQGYTKVDGYLHIGDFDDCTDLSLLSSLREVTGTLYIHNTASLTSLTGLENLTAVGGDVEIYNVDALTDTSPLAVSGTVAGIRIHYNDLLENLEGLSGITDVTGEVNISYSPALEDLSGLSNLAAIGGRLYVYDNDAAGLTSLAALSSLQSVGGYVEVDDNAALTELGLPALQTVDGYMDIDDNDALEYLELPALTRIGDADADDDFRVHRNDALLGFGDMNNLQTIHGDFEVGITSGYNDWSNGQIVNFDGLSALATVGGAVRVGYEPALRSMSGMAALASVGGQVYVYSCAVLNDISLPNLATIGENFYVYAGASAPDLGAISLPALTSVGTNFNISQSSSIQSVTIGTEDTTACLINGYLLLRELYDTETLALDGVETVGEYVGIRDNDALTTLSMNDLTSVGGDCSIWYNDQLPGFTAVELETVGGNLYLTNDSVTDYPGLNALTSVAGKFEIDYHDELQQITGFTNLTTVGGEFGIEENSKLQSVSGFTSLQGVGGLFEYYDNGQFAAGTGTVAFPALRTVGTDLEVTSNSGGMEELTIGTPGQEITIGTVTDGSVEITGNSDLTTVTLNGFVSIPVDLSLSWNFELVSADAPELQQIGGSLALWYSSGTDRALSSLSMPALTTLGGNLNASYTLLADLTGLDNLGTIGGNVTIQYNDNLATLFGASGQLSSIGGFLKIYQDDALTDLTGLSNLESIGAELWIEYNDVLPSLAALSTLDSIGREDGGDKGLYIKDNPELESLTGLEELDTIAGDLEINDNDDPLFTTLAPLAQIDADGIGNNLIIYSNDALEELTGLDNLAGAFPGGIEVYDNPSLRNSGGAAGLEALDAITSVAGGVRVDDNDALENLDFDALTSVDGNMHIDGNNVLSNLDDLDGLTTIGGTLTISNNTVLPDLGDGATTGFCDLASIGGGLNISDNGNLSNIDGLGNALLTIIGSAQTPDGSGANLTIENNDSLASLGTVAPAGLSTITEIRGSLIIDGNGDSAFTDLSDLAGLVTINGGVCITDNDNLESLFGASSALETIAGTYSTSVDGTLYDYSIVIDNVDALTSTDGLTGAMTDAPAVTANTVTSVTGRVIVYQNASLTNLDGFVNLQEVGAPLEIEENPLLTELGGTNGGLDNLAVADSDIRIRENTALTALPAMPNLNVIGGELEINNNGATGVLITDLGFDALTTIGNLLEIEYNFFDNTVYSGSADVETHFTDNTGWVGWGSLDISDNTYEAP